MRTASTPSNPDRTKLHFCRRHGSGLPRGRLRGEKPDHRKCRQRIVDAEATEAWRVPAQAYGLTE